MGWRATITIIWGWAAFFIGSASQCLHIGVFFVLDDENEDMDTYIDYLAVRSPAFVCACVSISIWRFEDSHVKARESAHVSFLISFFFLSHCLISFFRLILMDSRYTNGREDDKEPPLKRVRRPSLTNDKRERTMMVRPAVSLLCEMKNAVHIGSTGTTEYGAPADHCSIYRRRRKRATLSDSD